MISSLSCDEKIWECVSFPSLFRVLDEYRPSALNYISQGRRPDEIVSYPRFSFNMALFILGASCLTSVTLAPHFLEFEKRDKSSNT